MRAPVWSWDFHQRRAVDLGQSLSIRAGLAGLAMCASVPGLRSVVMRVRWMGSRPNGQLDSPALLSENALHQRDIRFRNGSLAKSFAQLGVRRVVSWGDKDHPEVFLVQPMYVPGRNGSPDCESAARAPKKRVDELCPKHCRRRVNGHGQRPCWTADNVRRLR